MEPIAFHLRAASPTFRDLPWEYPLEHWEGRCSRLVKAPSGLSRHTVLFINYDGNLYALKELPKGFARKEHHRLSQAQTLRLPAVVPIGYIELNIPQSEASVLVKIGRAHV